MDDTNNMLTTTTANPVTIHSVTKYQIHPLAEKFDPMQDADFDALVANIKINGFTELLGPVVLFQGKILDGRNRYLACLKAEVTPKVETFDGTYEEAEAFVVSANLHRRHLSAERKRELIAELVKAHPEKSDRSIAEEAKTSHVTVGKVRREIEATGKADQLEKAGASTGKTDQLEKETTQPKKRVGMDGKARKVVAKPQTTEPKKKKITQPTLNSMVFTDASLAERRKYFDAVGFEKVFEAFPPTWRPLLIAGLKQTPDDMSAEFYSKMTPAHLPKKLSVAVAKTFGMSLGDEKEDGAVAKLKSIGEDKPAQVH